VKVNLKIQIDFLQLKSNFKTYNHRIEKIWLIVKKTSSKHRQGTLSTEKSTDKNWVFAIQAICIEMLRDRFN